MHLAFVLLFIWKYFPQRLLFQLYTRNRVKDFWCTRYSKRETQDINDRPIGQFELLFAFLIHFDQNKYLNGKQTIGIESEMGRRKKQFGCWGSHALALPLNLSSHSCHLMLTDDDETVLPLYYMIVEPCANPYLSHGKRCGNNTHSHSPSPRRTNKKLPNNVCF